MSSSCILSKIHFKRKLKSLHVWKILRAVELATCLVANLAVSIPTARTEITRESFVTISSNKQLSGMGSPLAYKWHADNMQFDIKWRSTISLSLRSNCDWGHENWKRKIEFLFWGSILIDWNDKHVYLVHMKICFWWKHEHENFPLIKCPLACRGDFLYRFLAIECLQNKTCTCMSAEWQKSINSIQYILTIMPFCYWLDNTNMNAEFLVDGKF